MDIEEKKLENIIIQKIMKVRKNKKGTEIISKKQIGCLIAGVYDNHIVIGYSVCHRNDDYDVVGGRKMYGFGRTLAHKRALKWADEGVIDIPPGITNEVVQFVDRCKRYYKGLEAPAIRRQWWA